MWKAFAVFSISSLFFRYSQIFEKGNIVLFFVMDKTALNTYVKVLRRFCNFFTVFQNFRLFEKSKIYNFIVFFRLVFWVGKAFNAVKN